MNDDYTSAFGGTSGASPIIVGAALIVQGMHKAAVGSLLSPRQMRDLLSNPATGTAQGTGIAGNIGIMPNLRAIIENTPELRVDFKSRPAVFPTNAEDNKKSIYVVSNHGRLYQLWDTDHWNLDFPAELAGHTQLRFQQFPAVFATNEEDNKKSIYAITTDGRLAQIWDTDHWNLDFPAELANHVQLRFQKGVIVFSTDAGDNKNQFML
ncbi:hypothetical protein [Paraflavitalea speifideaquila]|uniref:hypothetical protein n=1 Tax=Paraflavitalea speifideaquila TaxID=3076558 RepID=UPI0028EEBFA6|nr:hypothetical protein [Paraflavitalea speifideiaquila]